jgi:hypothetical protein
MLFHNEFSDQQVSNQTISNIQVDQALEASSSTPEMIIGRPELGISCTANSMPPLLCFITGQLVAIIEPTDQHVCLVIPAIRSGINDFVMVMRVPMMTRAVGDRQLRQMTKISSACAMLCEVKEETVFRRYQRKQEYQLQAFTIFFTKI